ncbi:MAG: hypothetical protein EOM87_00260 [Clostridia bacterium]|nr:hypothetical protein [Clostridia bacterium]
MNNYVEKVPNKVKWWISIADSSCSVLGTIVLGGAFTYYFTQWRGMKADLVAIVWIIFAIWNAVNDPIYGYISDRTKSKLGRRIPYIRYGGILYGIIYALCFINWPGSGSNQGLMFVQMLVLLFLFDTLYTAVASALFVMPYEVAITNKARGSIILIKSILSFVPLAVGAVVIPMIQPGIGEDGKLYQIFNVGLGLFLGLIIFISTYFYKEKHVLSEEPQPNFLKSIFECLKNKQFIIYEILSFTVILVNGGLMLGLYYYLDEFEMVNKLGLYIGIGLGVVVGLITIPPMVKKFNVRNVLIVLCLIMSVVSSVMIVGGSISVIAAICFFMVGLGFAGLMYTIPIINGEVIDYDEVKVGQRREGIYAGVNSLITKPAQSLAQSAFLFIAVRMGYIENLAKGAQDSSGEKAILLGWMLLPAISMFVCFCVLFLFKLHGPEWEKVKEGLAIKHNEKSISKSEF